MKKAFLVWKYIKYLAVSKSKYHIHSPFVYTFIKEVLEDKKPYYAFEEIEMLRLFLLHSEESISVLDLGAGSHTIPSSARRVADIARTSLITKKFGGLLFRMVNFYQRSKILELGTSLGISTLYLAKANHNAHVISLEGSETVAAVARKNFDKTAITSIELLLGEFSDTLPVALGKLKVPDLIFIDGNHRKVPTLQYFHTCLQYSNEDSIFIFDDIHWSGEMESAWKEIKDHAAVTLSIDLFFKGIVFFRKDFPLKQHFVLRF